MSHNCWTTYRFYTLLLRWGVFPLFPPVSAFRFRGGEQKKKKREHDHRENSSKREKIRGWKSKEEFTRSWGVEKQQQRKKVKKKKKNTKIEDKRTIDIVKQRRLCLVNSVYDHDFQRHGRQNTRIKSRDGERTRSFADSELHCAWNAFYGGEITATTVDDTRLRDLTSNYDT